MWLSRSGWRSNWSSNLVIHGICSFFWCHTEITCRMQDKGMLIVVKGNREEKMGETIFKAHFLNVGHGDSILVELPE